MYAGTMQFLIMLHFGSMGMDRVIKHLIVVDIL